MATEKEKKDVEKEWEEKMEKRCNDWFSRGKKKNTTNYGSSGAVWFLGFIGAAIYYIQNATDFWNGFVGVLKALVWPAFLVYEALKALAM